MPNDSIHQTLSLKTLGITLHSLEVNNEGNSSFDVMWFNARGMAGTVNDELVLMIPTPTHWVRDLKEGVELMGMIENFKSNCSCLFFTTATPEEFADVAFRFPPRTESKMEKVILYFNAGRTM